MGNIFASAKPVTNLNSIVDEQIRIEYIEPTYFVTIEDEVIETRAQIHVYGSNGKHYAGHLENNFTLDELCTEFETSAFCERGFATFKKCFEVVQIIVKIQPVTKIGMCGFSRIETTYSYIFQLINGSTFKINVPLYRVF